MDHGFIKAVEHVAGNEDVVFNVGENTFFTNQDEGTRVRYVHSESEVVDWELKPLASLYEGNEPFLASDSDDWNDEYLRLFIAIETAIRREYRERSELKDKQVIAVLSRLVSNPEIRLTGTLVRLIQNNLRLCLSANPYSKKEVIGALRKVLKSVKRHHHVDGPRGYL